MYFCVLMKTLGTETATVYVKRLTFVLHDNAERTEYTFPVCKALPMAANEGRGESSAGVSFGSLVLILPGTSGTMRPTQTVPGAETAI